MQAHGTAAVYTQPHYNTWSTGRRAAIIPFKRTSSWSVHSANEQRRPFAECRVLGAAQTRRRMRPSRACCRARLLPRRCCQPRQLTRRERGMHPAGALRRLRLAAQVLEVTFTPVI